MLIAVVYAINSVGIACIHGVIRHTRPTIKNTRQCTRFLHLIHKDAQVLEDIPIRTSTLPLNVHETCQKETKELVQNNPQKTFNFLLSSLYMLYIRMLDYYKVVISIFEELNKEMWSKIAISFISQLIDVQSQLIHSPQYIKGYIVTFIFKLAPIFPMCSNIALFLLNFVDNLSKRQLNS